MANFTGPTQVAGGDTIQTHTTAMHGLGTYVETADGRGFRYCKVGASALVAGNVIQAPAQITTHDQLTPAAAAIGATQITVTLDATNDATANYYAEGWAVIDTTPGEGHAYQIQGHLLIAASAAGIFYLKEPIRVALTTSSRVTLVPNPYRGVIQSPVTTLTGAVVGAAPAPHPANEFGWIQTHGAAAVLIAGTPGVGLAVVVPATAAGAVVVDGAAAATQVVGSMMVTGVDGKILPVYLTID